jgi:hypothetical protein
MNKPDTQNDSRWSGFYKVGGTAALLVVLVALLDIIMAMLSGEAKENSAITVIEWFALFQNNPLSAFSNLGLFNIIYLALAIPLYLALYHIHRQVHQAYAALAIILFCIGATVYFSTNTVFAMFALSRQYMVAITEAQKSIFIAAGQAALAQGADLTPGVFMGFFFTEAAGIVMAIVMLQSGIFSKLTAWVGILALGSMLIFNTLAAFLPANYDVAMMFATLGGPLSMAYYILIARRLFQLGRLEI